MTYEAEVLADSPDVYYRLDETGSGPFVDIANGHNLTPDGTIVNDASLLPNDPGPSAAFNYSTGTLTKATGSYTVSQQPLTIELWVKPLVLTGSSSGFTVLAGVFPGGWTVGYQDTTGKWQLIHQGFNVYTFTAAAAAGSTYHVVWIMRATNQIDLYVNGAFSQTITPSEALGAATGTLQISGATTLARAKASVAKVAVYKAALSAARIAAHYAAGRTFLVTAAATQPQPSASRRSVAHASSATQAQAAAQLRRANRAAAVTQAQQASALGVLLRAPVTGEGIGSCPSSVPIVTVTSSLACEPLAIGAA